MNCIHTRLLTSTVLAVGLLFSACGGTEEDGFDPNDGLEQSDDELRGRLNATGDACDIALPGGTKEPGTENDKGECCSTLHPETCVVILKPFPGVYRSSARR